MSESEKQLQGKRSKMSEHEVAPTRLDIRQPHGSSVEDTNCHGHFSILASLELPDQTPDFGRRMLWLWAARRAFETMEPPCETRFFGKSSSEFTHPGDSDWRTVFWRKVKKNRTNARTALVTHRWYGPAIVVGKEKNNVFVSCRVRVTRVAL